jgi:hypothetical protein
LLSQPSVEEVMLGEMTLALDGAAGNEELVTLPTDLVVRREWDGCTASGRCPGLRRCASGDLSREALRGERMCAGSPADAAAVDVASGEKRRAVLSLDMRSVWLAVG